MIKLVCGLGNPGKEYAQTRHNAGWQILDTLEGGAVYQKKFKGEFAKVFIREGSGLILLKPLTFMNKSGESLKACMDFFGLRPDEIVVLHDELELSFGRWEIKNGGGLGGHNGLKSIVQHIGTKDFLRLRFGIGRPSHGNVSSYVLSRYAKEEEAFLPGYLEEAASCVREYLKSR